MSHKKELLWSLWVYTRDRGVLERHEERFSGCGLLHQTLGVQVHEQDRL